VLKVCAHCGEVKERNAMNKRTFGTLEIGDCFYFINTENRRLSGPYIKTHLNGYLATCKVINGDYVEPRQGLSQTWHALVELLPSINLS
jgi:hypothetical protein